MPAHHATVSNSQSFIAHLIPISAAALMAFMSLPIVVQGVISSMKLGLDVTPPMPLLVQMASL